MNGFDMKFNAGLKQVNTQPKSYSHLTIKENEKSLRPLPKVNYESTSMMSLI